MRCYFYALVTARNDRKCCVSCSEITIAFLVIVSLSAFNYYDTYLAVEYKK